mmetsp:Transcript_20799/g.49189  ORF Transcript_20799/g.49189 Transcript_20799/m.49189 type:complete len:123 (+) Transcript_20799:596-964(+)
MTGSVADREGRSSRSWWVARTAAAVPRRKVGAATDSYRLVDFVVVAVCGGSVVAMMASTAAGEGWNSCTDVVAVGIVPARKIVDRRGVAVAATADCREPTNPFLGSVFGSTVEEVPEGDYWV